MADSRREAASELPAVLLSAALLPAGPRHLTLSMPLDMLSKGRCADQPTYNCIDLINEQDGWRSHAGALEGLPQQRLPLAHIHGEQLRTRQHLQHPARSCSAVMCRTCTCRVSGAGLGQGPVGASRLFQLQRAPGLSCCSLPAPRVAPS